MLGPGGSRPSGLWSSGGWRGEVRGHHSLLLPSPLSPRAENPGLVAVLARGSYGGRLGFREGSCPSRGWARAPVPLAQQPLCPLTSETAQATCWSAVLRCPRERSVPKGNPEWPVMQETGDLM